MSYSSERYPTVITRPAVAYRFRSDFALDNSICVLVVEDEPIIRIDLADFLVQSGFDVLEAADADEAVELLERNDEIRLLITDVDMPGSMDGLMLAQAVADRWPPVRIIVVSGHRMVEMTDIPDGSVFLSKPLSQPAMLASMHDLLH